MVRPRLATYRARGLRLGRNLRFFVPWLTIMHLRFCPGSAEIVEMLNRFLILALGIAYLVLLTTLLVLA